MDTIDKIFDNFKKFPTEENGKVLMKTIAKSFGDNSFTENHFNKVQDLITSESSKHLQFDGFNFSEHLSNTLRSCFKHNKRNDLIINLRPTSVIKFSDIKSFGDDSVALIQQTVINAIPKYKINYHDKNINTISSMEQNGGNYSEYYNSNYNFRSTTNKPITTTEKKYSEKKETNKLLGGFNSESLSLNFVTIGNELKTNPTSLKMPKNITSPRDTDESMPNNTESNTYLKYAMKKASSGSFKRPITIKSSPDMLSRKKSYELRKLDNKNELSLMFSTERKGGQNITTDTTNLEKIEETINQLSELSQVNITKIDPTQEEFTLEYFDLGLKISVDCLLNYIIDPNINNAGVCEQKYLQQLVDLNGNLDINKYFTSNTSIDDEKTYFINKSIELYKFINNFVSKVESNDGLSKYDEDTQIRIKMNLHVLISNYIQYVTSKISELSIINNDLINSATNLIGVHNKLILKELDDGTSLINLNKHLEEFYKLSKENLAKVNELSNYLSVKPNEEYDPSLISEIKTRADKLEEKIKSLELISNEMKNNLTTFQKQLK